MRKDLEEEEEFAVGSKVLIALCCRASPGAEGGARQDGSARP